MIGNIRTHQTKVTSRSFIHTKHIDPRYKVYVGEIRKRLTYAGFSLFFAWMCAYTQRVALMYSITFSLQHLQQPLSEETDLFTGYTQSPSHPAFTSPMAANTLLTRQTSFRPEELRGENLYYGEGVEEPLWLSSINEHGAVRLIFTDIEEAFYTLLSVSLFWCFWACLPLLVYHTLCFFQPGFYTAQSKRICVSVLKRITWGYLVLWLVDFLLIPRLLSFFYSFEIGRSSLCLHAETKVTSYISLYVFVYSSTVSLLLVTGLWGGYRRRQILHWLNSCTDVAMLDAKQGVMTESWSVNSYYVGGKDVHCGTNGKEQGFLNVQYRNQRGKIWWSCLLFAAMVSPPEISSQLACAFFLIIWSEISIWLAYVSSCRVFYQMRDHSLYT